MYIAKHSECACLILDSLLEYRKYEKDLKNLKHLKAIVFYSAELSDTDLRNLVNPFVPIYLWKEFLKLGKRSTIDIEFKNRVSMQNPGNCCNLIYTCGTTGTPKGVMLSHDNMSWVARSIENDYGKIIGTKQKVISFLPLSHIAAQVCDILSILNIKCSYYDH